MSVTYPRVMNGFYVSNLSDDRLRYIDSILSSESIPALKNMIFNFPAELVLRSLEEKKSIRRIVKEDTIDWQPYVGELRDYQTKMTAFMYMSPRSINGDYVGLGKTAEVSALINFLKQKGELTRFCIAVEGSAYTQTTCEIIKFTGLRVVELPGETVKLRKIIKGTDWENVDGIVCKHSTLKNDCFMQFLSRNISEQGVNKVFNTLFIDESTVIKNRETKFCEYILEILRRTPRCHLMNATPFEKSIMDIYTQLDVLDTNLLPKKYKIESMYSTWKTSYFWTKVKGEAVRHPKRERTGYKNQAEFKRSLKYVYWGRSKKDVGKELPHNYRTLTVTPTNDQKVCIGNGYRYQEVLNCPSLVEDINIATNRKNVPKIDLVCRLLEEQYQDAKVMIYVWNPKAQEAIADELIKIGRKPAIIQGGMKDVDKWQIQQDFNAEDGKYDVLITNARKSLNLYGADVCILYSVESSSGLYTQICGRIDRSVDDKIRDFILLVYEDSPEYKYLTSIVKSRAEDSRALTIDAKGAIDHFIEYLEREE